MKNNKNKELIKSIIIIVVAILVVIAFIYISKSSREELINTEIPINTLENNKITDISTQNNYILPVNTEANTVLGNEENLPIKPTGTTINVNKISCESKGGTWYTDNNVCEINSLSENECTTNGGEFNSCASACRHNPKAEICTMQCVLTCTFK